jgi:hypothetical protein
MLGVIKVTVGNQDQNTLQLNCRQDLRPDTSSSSQTEQDSIIVTRDTGKKLGQTNGNMHTTLGANFG